MEEKHPYLVELILFIGKFEKRVHRVVFAPGDTGAKIIAMRNECQFEPEWIHDKWGEHIEDGGQAAYSVRSARLLTDAQYTVLLVLGITNATKQIEP